MEVRCQPLTGETMRWLTDTVYGVSNPHDAAARNRVSKIKKYVQQGGDVSKKNKLGDTPLHEACAYIRDNGATSKGERRNGCIGVRRRMGKLAQDRLGEGGPLEMLELLVRAGSDINAQNIVGDAPLHKAALNGRVLAAGYLIRAGADVNVRNEFAQTPLHMACVSGSIEVVQKLVQGGADTNAQDATEETPFHEACRHQYENIVIYLMRQVENADTSEDLRLWRGLDASRKKSIRTRVQDRVDRAGDREQPPPASALATAPATVAQASASTGSSPDELEMSTPSTLRNSMPSAESSRGQTPPGSKKFSASQNTVGGGVILSNDSSKTKSVSPPMETMAKITNGHNDHRALREEQTNVAIAHATANIEDKSMMAPTNYVADVAGSDDGTQGKKDFGTGGVEVGSVLLTSTHEGRGVLRPEMKASPSAAGRVTPQSRVPTREGVRRASIRKSNNVLVLQSPRPRVSRRSLTHPDFAKESARTGRDVGSKAGDTNGSEGSSRRSSSFPKGGSHTHAVGARSRKSAALVDAENISGSGSGPNSPEQIHHCSRKREDSGGACGGIGLDVDIDVDGHVAGKSSHRQRRHRNRDLDSKRSSPARDTTVQRRQHHRHEGVEILCRDGHSQWFYGEREVPQQHSEEADGLRKERGTTASLRGVKKHRRDHCSGNGSDSGSSSARDVPRREPKCGRSASGVVVAPGNIPLAVKVGVEGAKMTIPRTGTSCAHNGPPRKEVQRKTKVVAREKSRGGHGRSVKRPHRLSGSGQELVLAPPTWASEIDIGLGKLLPYKKKVIESPVPVKRNSPYIPYRISNPSPRLKSGGAAMRANVSPRKDGFFPLGTSRARTPASSRRQPEDVLLGAAADSSPPAPFISIGHSRKASVANGAVAAGVSGAAPASKAVFDTDTEDDDPPGIEALHAGLSAAGAGAGTSANGVEVIVRSEGGTSVKLTSWAKTSVKSSVKRAATANSQGAVVFSDSDTDNDRASSGGVQASAASTMFGNLRCKPATPAPAHPPVPPSVESTSSFLPRAGTVIKDEGVELATEKSAEGAASSLDFHDSFGASFPTSPGEESRAVVDAIVAVEAAPNTSVTFPSSRNELGVAKSLSGYRSGGDGSIPTKRAWVAGVRAAAAESKAIGGAVRVQEPLAVDLGDFSRLFDSCSTQDSGKRVTDLESEVLEPELPTVAPSPATFEGASSIKPSFALIPIPLPANSDKSLCAVHISRSQASAPAAEQESTKEAPVEREANTVLETSTVPFSTGSHAASPREPVKSMPASMIAHLSPKLPAASQKHSSLGRRGQPLVKANMPIVGGQAAWNKFLADAVAEGDGTSRIEKDDDAAGSAFHGDEARGSVDAEKDGEEKEDGDEQDPLHIERAPRGFKNPAQAEGSNKGPAGAFSGNSMWRLAGGATSAADRTRSGLKVNGDGGFSNPLAAMRASNARKTPEIGTAEGEAARGEASLNPLSGLRGATAMNGVGIANPLARGRSLRLGTAGAVNLPLDGIGAGTTNPMARRATSAAFAAPTVGYDREGPGERTRPTTIMGDRSRVDSVGGRNEIPSAFAPSIVQLAEKSLRMYDLALPSSISSLSLSSASADLASSGGAAAEAGRGGFKEPLSSEAASAVRPSGGDEVLQRGGFCSNGRPPPLRLRRERTVRENELLEADRDPGQAKVTSAVMAFQKMSNPRAGMIKDPHQIEVSTVAEQGLVQLRRVNWSPLTVQTNGP